MFSAWKIAGGIPKGLEIFDLPIETQLPVDIFGMISGAARPDHWCSKIRPDHAACGFFWGAHQKNQQLGPEGGGNSFCLKKITPIWGRCTRFWRAYFSDGLNEPTN